MLYHFTVVELVAENRLHFASISVSTYIYSFQDIPLPSSVLLDGGVLISIFFEPGLKIWVFEFKADGLKLFFHFFEVIMQDIVVLYDKLDFSP